MNEIWKDVEGYEGLYQVSNLGRVKSLGNNKNRKEKIMKISKNKDGYLYIDFHRNGKHKKFLIHRLVAQTFLDNPNNLPQVNHKDENPTNNSVDNLEWCNSKYNNNYGTRNNKASNTLSKPILQFTKTGEFIRKWDSATQVKKEIGINQGDISNCLKGNLKTAGGYKWCYAVINGFTIDISKLKKVA